MARGDEKGIRSPLADSTMLCVLKRLTENVPTFMGIIGYGCDGELTLDELNRNVAEIAKQGGLLGARGLTDEDKTILERILPKTHSEASALVLESAKGGYGERTIREGRRHLHLTHFASVTLYFDPKVVYEMSSPAKLIDKTNSLADADGILRDAGYMTELYFEEKLAERKD